MTRLEKLQPNVVFVNVGKKAFRMKIMFNDNPYKLHPYKTLWEKGYMAERRKWERERKYFEQ